MPENAPLGWLSHREHPHMEGVIRTLAGETSLTRLHDGRQLRRWAREHPRGRLVVRTPLQYSTEIHATIRHFGLRSLNTLAFLESVSDRKLLFAALTRASIPQPEDYRASSSHYVVKPRAPYEHTFTHSDQRLDSGTRFAQKWVPNDGVDFKVYVLGDQLFGFLRPTRLRKRPIDKLRDSTPTAIPPQVRHIATAMRRCLGGEIFGFDLVRSSDDRYYVVDVNAFPSMKIVPGIESMMTACVLAWVHRKPASRRGASTG